MQLDAKLSQVQPLGGGGGSRWRRIKDGECWKGVWSGTSNICGCRLSLHSVLQSKAGRWCICREAPVGQPSVCNSPNGSSFLGQMIYPWSAPAFFFSFLLRDFSSLWEPACWTHGFEHAWITYITQEILLYVSHTSVAFSVGRAETGIPHWFQDLRRAGAWQRRARFWTG